MDLHLLQTFHNTVTMERRVEIKIFGRVAVAVEQVPPVLVEVAVRELTIRVEQVEQVLQTVLLILHSFMVAEEEVVVA
jgi:hypothetical protein